MPEPDPTASSAIIALAFPTPERAKQALAAARTLHRHGMLVVHDAVLVLRPTNARATVHETRDPSPTAVAIPTAVLAAVIGVLIAGPVGLLVGAALGAGAGALAAKLIDLGIPDAVVLQLRELTSPGDTVLALQVADVHGSEVIDQLRQFQGARVIYATLPEATLALVRRTLTPDAGAHA